MPKTINLSLASVVILALLALAITFTRAVSRLREASRRERYCIVQRLIRFYRNCIPDGLQIESYADYVVADRVKLNLFLNNVEVYLKNAEACRIVHQKDKNE